MSNSGQTEVGLAASNAAKLEEAAAHGESLPLSLAPGGAFVEQLTRMAALVGGVFLLGSIILTLISVIGRYLLSMPVPGDYELVEIACGIAVFLFFPFTHAVGSNISAEFFTSGMALTKRRFLDVLNDIVFTLIAALFTWRMTHAFEEKLASGETSILIGIPLWWPYAIGVCCLGFLTIVCALRVLAGIAALRQD
jgi:TRAP-type C4-dicarboxylate transport system permease small subunit